jgi:hypothetical protein
MSRELKSYEYLWDGSDASWALVDSYEASRVEDMIVVNVINKSALIIENDDLAKMVIAKMIEAGVKVKKASEVF